MHRGQKQRTSEFELKLSRELRGVIINDQRESFGALIGRR